MLPRLSLTRWIALAVVGLALAAGPATAQDAGQDAGQDAQNATQDAAQDAQNATQDAEDTKPAPYGVWMPEDEESMVEFYDCSDAMCARVVWMHENRDEDGEILTDIYNPDPDRRSVPVLGLEIMTDIKPTDEDKVWQGRVYNPKDGRTYDFWLTVKSEEQITIQGCGLYNLVCQTHTWNRVDS